MIFDKELLALKKSAQTLKEITEESVEVNKKFLAKFRETEDEINKNLQEYSKTSYAKIKKEFKKSITNNEEEVPYVEAVFKKLDTVKDFFEQQNFIFIDFNPVFNHAFYLQMPNLVEKGPLVYSIDRWVAAVWDFDKNTIETQEINRYHYLSWLNALYGTNNNRIDIATLLGGITSDSWKTIPIIRNLAKTYNLIRWFDGKTLDDNDPQKADIAFATFEQTFELKQKEKGKDSLMSSFVGAYGIERTNDLVLDVKTMKIEKPTIKNIFKFLENVFPHFKSKAYFDELVEMANKMKDKEKAAKAQKEKH